MDEGELSRNDLILTRRAIRSDWPIPADARGQIVAEMLRILSGNTSNRVRIAAARVLVSADSLNVGRERLDLQAELQNPSVSKATDHRVVILPKNGRESANIQQTFQQFDAMEPEYREWKAKKELARLIGEGNVNRNGSKSQILGSKPAADEC